MKKSILEKYAKNNHRSVLYEHIEDIKELLEHGASQVNIILYLKEEQGITTTKSNLSQFIKRHIQIATTFKQEKLEIKKEPSTQKESSPKKKLSIAEQIKKQGAFRI